MYSRRPGRSRPFVANAEKLSAEAASGHQRGDDLIPDGHEAIPWAERQREARIHEIGHRPRCVLEAGNLSLQSAGCVTIVGDALHQTVDTGGLGVDRKHTPSSLEKLCGVTARATAEVDGERFAPTTFRLVLTADEGYEQRVSRL